MIIQLQEYQIQEILKDLGKEEKAQEILIEQSLKITEEILLFPILINMKFLEINQMKKQPKKLKPKLQKEWKINLIKVQEKLDKLLLKLIHN